MFGADEIEQLYETISKTVALGQALMLRATFRPYSTKRGQEYALHGFSRRLGTLGHCLEGVFDAIPPERNRLPTKGEVRDAEAFLHSFIVNCFGAFDNLAHIWVAERGVQKKSGKPLGRQQIGLTAKCEDVRASLPPTVREKLVSFADWFRYLEDYRDALAHRIPVYIADRAYRPEDLEIIKKIRAQKEVAFEEREFSRVHELMDKEDKIGCFNPLMMHSYNENAAQMYFHSQLLCDHYTVIEFGDLIFDALDNQKP